MENSRNKQKKQFFITWFSYSTHLKKMTSWKKTIATPFKKAATFFNQPQQTPHNRHANAKEREEHERRSVKELQGDVMACGYEDVLVMWSIVDKSNPSNKLSS
ncbi:hypothetical protein Bca4012_037756 [Brassica carinata]